MTQQIKDLKYYKNNAEEDYLTTPISVLRYIGELEAELHKTPVVGALAEQLPHCTLNAKTCNKGSVCKYPHCHL